MNDFPLGYSPSAADLGLGVILGFSPCILAASITFAIHMTRHVTRLPWVCTTCSQLLTTACTCGCIASFKNISCMRMPEESRQRRSIDDCDYTAVRLSKNEDSSCCGNCLEYTDDSYCTGVTPNKNEDAASCCGNLLECCTYKSTCLAQHNIGNMQVEAHQTIEEGPRQCSIHQCQYKSNKAMRKSESGHVCGSPLHTQQDSLSTSFKEQPEDADFTQVEQDVSPGFQQLNSEGEHTTFLSKHAWTVHKILMLFKYATYICIGKMLTGNDEISIVIVNTVLLSNNLQQIIAVANH